MNIPDELTDKSRGIRLQKAMARAGVASRRSCEDLIEAGRVRVNGRTVQALPVWVDPEQDLIEVDGEPLPRRRGATTAKTYIMVHKPRRVISTNDDPEGRPRVLDLIDAPIKARLFPVGRLDAESTGLILLTDDGGLAQCLTHPRYGVPKRYLVSVRGRLSETDLERLHRGLHLSHRSRGARRATADQVRIVGYQQDRSRGDRTTLAVTLREGQNRQIRRLLARLGFKVRRLKRVAIGPLKLKGLAVGQWRMLSNAEVKMLQKAAGATKMTR